MKRVKAFAIVVCLLITMMSLSSVALAAEVGAGVSFSAPCPLCNVQASLKITSFRQATANLSGFFAVSCSNCGRNFSRSTKYWGSNYVMGESLFGLYDVILYEFDRDNPELCFISFYRPSTCTETGHCRIQRFSIVNYASDSTIPFLRHSYIETSRIPATCTTSGSVVFTCTRSGCNETKTEALPALGHDYTSKRTEPTCTALGSIVTTCSRCNDTKTEVLPALGHDYSVSSCVEPTCTTPGFIVSTCSRCNDAVTEELPAAYHSWDTVEMVPSTYDDSGNIVTEGYTFYTCSTCGSNYTAVAGTSPPDYGLVSDGIGGTGMQDTTAALGKTFLSGIWSLFTITVPGFGFTFGQMWLGVLLASLSILVIRMIFGFGGCLRGESSRTSSTNNPKISKERRHDEF